MKLNRPKWTLAALLVTCAVGAAAWRVARATPAAGVTRTAISGPIRFDEMDAKVHDRAYDWKATIKTEGQSDVYVQELHIAPGGTTGWHSHPGPVFVSVKSGIATEYDGDSCARVDHFPGTGFLDPGGGHVHTVRNETTADLDLVVVFVVPAGAPTRIDEADPGCPGV